MRALVTGSAGFIGRHMAARLEADGYDVIRVDLREDITQPGLRYRDDIRRWWVDEGEFVEVDLVVHCAAVVGGRTMIDGARLLLAAEDLSIDAELFRWLLARKTPPRTVYYSSAAAYPVRLQDWGAMWHSGGKDLVRTLAERQINLGKPELPDATYGWVKLTGERMAAEANLMGIPVHVFRPFSGYGTDQDDTYPFPAIMQRIREHRDPITIWGDPDSTRDWIHVDDVIDGTLAWVGSERTEPVNLCTGVDTSFTGLVKLAAQVATLIATTPGNLNHWAASYDPYVPAVDADRSKPMGVLHRVGDPTLMAEVFTPQITLTEGIRRALTVA